MSSCRKATFLISKKEEGKLSSAESVSLAYHLSVCSLCRSFEKQTSFFSMKKRNPPVTQMPDESKKRLEKFVERIITSE